MSKAKTISDNSFPTNQEIILKYLEKFNHSKAFKSTVRTALKIFNEYYIESFEFLDIKDLKGYHQFLNESKKWTLKTKIHYFGYLKRFIEDFMLEYSEFFEPKQIILFMMFLKDIKTLKFNKEHYHKESERDNDVVLEKNEISEILSYLKKKDTTKYLMVRCLVETGMRKGELLSINLTTKFKGKIIPIEEDLRKRLLRVIGKTGKKVYYITESLSRVLTKFVVSRKKRISQSNSLFISSQSKRVCKCGINQWFYGYDRILKDGTKTRTLSIAEVVEIDKHISPKTFRLTLNDYRERMDCPEKYLKILLNHKSSGVNYTHYVSDETKRAKFLEYYDIYNPYKNLKL